MVNWEVTLSSPSLGRLVGFSFNEYALSKIRFLQLKARRKIMLRSQNFTKIRGDIVLYECLVVRSVFTPSFRRYSSEFLMIMWEKDSFRWLCCGLESFS